eukprot:snap_masked-scaffold_19-processed-gene-2.18-mRNA-1 protein AED:1.00 eAED:1.00 QI:0/-1/0/0/-1/1/1/0/85
MLKAEVMTDLSANDVLAYHSRRLGDQEHLSLFLDGMNTKEQEDFLKKFCPNKIEEVEGTSQSSMLPIQKLFNNSEAPTRVISKLS